MTIEQQEADTIWVTMDDDGYFMHAWAGDVPPQKHDGAWRAVASGSYARTWTNLKNVFNLRPGECIEFRRVGGEK